jgi:hypothetical protein
MAWVGDGPLATDWCSGFSAFGAMMEVGDVPTVLREGRFRFFFYSGNGSEPPHMHVDGGGNAKIWLLPVPHLAYSYGYNRAEKRALIEIARQRRGELLNAWREHFGH